MGQLVSNEVLRSGSGLHCWVEDRWASQVCHPGGPVSEGEQRATVLVPAYVPLPSLPCKIIADDNPGPRIRMRVEPNDLDGRLRLLNAYGWRGRAFLGPGGDEMYPVLCLGGRTGEEGQKPQKH